MKNKLKVISLLNISKNKISLKKYTLLLSLFVAIIFNAKITYSKDKIDDKSDKYVIILSMDAFRWDLAEHGSTPTLDSLKKVGSYANIIPVYPSNTFPSHYSMATGLHPDNHGIVNNNFYHKGLNRYISVFDKEAIETDNLWGGEPIWNTAERQGCLANIFMWTGSDVPINGRQATVWTKYSTAPTYYERADMVIDAMMRAEGESPNLVMWYFNQPDGVMHHNGPISEESIQTAEYIDSVLAYFFAKIKESPVYDKINFIITADHGMADISPKRYINLYNKIDRKKIIRKIYGNPFGIEAKEEHIGDIVDQINKLDHLKAYRRENLPKHLHYGSNAERISNIVIIPEIGWTIDYSSKDRRLSKKGAHGYDNTHSDMHMIFYATGPDFKRGYKQKSFQNQNIYLIMCHILGIEPAKNDGSWDDVKDMFM